MKIFKLLEPKEAKRCMHIGLCYYAYKRTESTRPWASKSKLDNQYELINRFGLERTFLELVLTNFDIVMYSTGQ